MEDQEEKAGKRHGNDVPHLHGDQITVKDIKEGGAIAAGRGARANVFTVIIKDIRWWPVIFLLMGGIGFLAYLLLQLRPSKPEEMKGLFNVAVAELMVIDDNGKILKSEDGVEVANFLSQQIKTKFEDLEIQKTISYEVWGPYETGQILGDTAVERSVAAEEIARRIGAHIIIYGVINSQGEQSEFAPEFYINPISFRDADAFTGQSKLGKKIRIARPFKGQGIPSGSSVLAARGNILSEITLGLAFYSIDDFKNALVYFNDAEANEKWLDTTGKEIIYLLIGNSYLRIASKELSFDYLPQASENFSKALNIDRNCARALLGQASVIYMRALGDTNSQDVDGELLSEAEALLNSVLDLGNEPENANIETKVHLSLGRINMARVNGRIPGGNWLEEVKKELNYVIKDYETGDQSVAPLASHAYAVLGFVASYEGEFDKSVNYVEQAIDLASPFYEGEYYSLLGDLYAEDGQIDLARNAYENAVVVAESIGNVDMVEKYESKIDELQKSMSMIASPTPRSVSVVSPSTPSPTLFSPTPTHPAEPSKTKIPLPTVSETILGNESIIASSDSQPTPTLQAVESTGVSDLEFPETMVFLPVTGFTPGQQTVLPDQPANTSYQNLGALWLEIPSLELHKQIVGVPFTTENGWDIRWLGDQLGYLEGTAFPTSSGNSFITGHVYHASGQAGPFVNLKDMQTGDSVILRNPGNRYVYQVEDIQIARADDISIFQNNESDHVTLITCFGYNAVTNSYDFRVIVQSALVKIDRITHRPNKTFK